MKVLVFSLVSLLSFAVFSQETKEIAEEFIPIEVEGKEAYISTKTGEYTYRKHNETDPTQLKTTDNGVVYTDISNHTVKKGETLYLIAKKNAVTVADLKKHNKISNANLKIGTALKVVKTIQVKSSSPVISYAGEERIIARLRPGESPGALAPPPPMEEIQKKLIKTHKTRAQPLKPAYKTDEDIKNPILGLNDKVEETVTETTEKPVVKESKKERLKRLKALETELEEASTKTEEEHVHNEHDGDDHGEHNKSKEDSEEAVEVVKNNEVGKPILVSEEKKTITYKAEEKEESLAKRALRVVSQVKKTNKKAVVEAKKSSEDKIQEAKEGKNTHFYTVEKGNSLWSIAKKHNMTVATLKKLNNLKSNYLSVGQQLKVTSEPKK